MRSFLDISLRNYGDFLIGIPLHPQRHLALPHPLARFRSPAIGIPLHPHSAPSQRHSDLPQRFSAFGVPPTTPPQRFSGYPPLAVFRLPPPAVNLFILPHSGFPLTSFSGFLLNPPAVFRFIPPLIGFPLTSFPLYISRAFSSAYFLHSSY